MDILLLALDNQIDHDDIHQSAGRDYRYSMQDFYRRLMKFANASGVKYSDGPMFVLITKPGKSVNMLTLLEKFREEMQ
jgi:hypothetical protein